MLGWDYQHVYPLGGDRYLWLFQDTFIDHTGVVSNLGKARFVHNAAIAADRHAASRCCTAARTAKPEPFELGDGTGNVRTKWYWPMGGELVGRQPVVFWAEMVKDPYDPDPPDGLGWHPSKLYMAAYDQKTLGARGVRARPGFRRSAPIYGYAVSSDATHTYLFGNTFEQNMVREGGFWSGPHSATKMWLARVPRGQLTARPEYRTADGWSPIRADAVPIVSRYFAENPMQPRFLDGQWVSATKVDGYWGEDLAIDVAPERVGPVDHGRLLPPPAPRQRSQDEQLSRPSAAVARRLRFGRGHRLEQRPQHAARRLAATRPVSTDADVLAVPADAGADHDDDHAPPRRPPRPTTTTLPPTTTTSTTVAPTTTRGDHHDIDDDRRTPTSTVATTTTTTSTTTVPGRRQRLT